MRLICGPSTYSFPTDNNALQVILYGQADRPERGSVGAAIKDQILRKKFLVPHRAWDFLSLALSILTADIAGHRNRSPDGWTREFNVEVAVVDPDFWNSQRSVVHSALAFLTTDRWQVSFVSGGFQSATIANPVSLPDECIVLLSGGLDSLIGAVDLAASSKHPYAVSQIVRGDAKKQELLAQRINGGLGHLQLNHNTYVPYPEKPPSQRARSLVFLAYGVLAATALTRYEAGEIVTLYICENGFISINPPLTGARLGSLSTRTSHPVFLRQIQHVVDAAGLRVQMDNPYQLKTKGEMLSECKDQAFLNSVAAITTSCGRFNRYGNKHCGRCVPCQIRRAAFLNSQLEDSTEYVYKNLGKDDKDHAGFDDVRSVAMAIARAQIDGFDNWLGTALTSTMLSDTSELKAVMKRGLDELAALHHSYGVK